MPAARTGFGTTSIFASITAVSLAVGCAQGGVENGGGGDEDAGLPGGNGNDNGFGDPVDAAPAPDAADGPDAAPDDPSVTLTHNVDTDTVATEHPEGLGEPFVGCYGVDDGDPVNHVEMQYYKVFDLEGDFGVTDDLLLEDFRMGALDAVVDGDAIEGVELNFYAQDDGTVPDLDGSEELESIGVTLPPDGEGVNYPTAGLGLDLTDLDSVDEDIVVPAGQSLLVEFALPDGSEDGELFLIGVNFEGEDRGSFVRAPESEGCSMQEITPFGDIEDGDGNNLGDRDWVVILEGEELR